MTAADRPSGRLRSDRVLLWSSGLALAVYPVFALRVWPERYVALVSESGIGEMATAVLFAGAALLVGRGALDSRRSGRPWIPAALLAAGLLFVCGEEISWGQRLLGYGLPALQSANLQHEINLHNLTPVVHVLEQSLAPLVTLLYGVALPLSRVGGRLRASADSWNLPVPPRAAIPLFAGAALAFLPSPVYRHVEIAELLLAAGMLVTAAAARPGSAEASDLRRGRRALGLSLGVAMTIVLLGPLVGLEAREYESRLLLLENFHVPFGWTDGATALLEREASRYDGWMNAGTSVGALTLRQVLADPDKRHPAILDAALRRGRIDLARTRVDLAVLYRLANREADATAQLVEAQALVDEEQRDGELTTPAATLTRVRLLACQGRDAEARAVVESRYPPSFHRIKRAHLASIDRLERIFASR